MANRPRGFGLTAELNKKKAAKFDAELSTESFKWMKGIFEDAEFFSESEALSIPVEKQEDVMKPLKDGVLLCKLINCIAPDTVKRIHTSKMAFKMMENINNFLEGCENLGCKKYDLFQSIDLYEGQNIHQVINGIMALGRKAQSIGYDGPCLGPAESTENKREFTEEQLRAGEGIINLQAGSNQGATQAGQNFGKTRAILD